MRSLTVSVARSLATRQYASATQRGWVCSRCSYEQPIRRRLMSSKSSASKPYYVTTPIFYVNASPHIGHMYSMILTDVFKRWQTLKGRKALLCTGTDEHGMKVQRAAAAEGVPPKEFCDANAEKFKELALACNIDNDFFIRTTDADHIDAVKHFWFMLKERGHIYESKHEGWYCVSDECFYSESEVEKTLQASTGKILMTSKSTGNEVEWTAEKNYHFRMTAFKDRLLQFYKENPDWIAPNPRMAEVTNWVTNNLEDLSISRPVNRLEWGIRVPDDPTQTIYVWVDALINYMTKAGFPNWQPGHQQDGGWPADLHVIGKDITRFHCIYWPALLMALDIPIPKRVLSHGHWLMGKFKMSKSLGNVVNPFSAIEMWGLDTLRYFMVREGGFAKDSAYENTRIHDRYKKDLASTLGNLLNRVARSKVWTVDEAVAWAKEADLAASTQADASSEFQAVILEKVQKASSEMEELNPSGMINNVFDILIHANGYMADMAPWDAAQSSDPESQATLGEIIFHSAEALRISGILLQPVMPAKMAALLDTLGVAPDRRTFKDAKFGEDLTYGGREGPLLTGSWYALFPPLPAKS